MRAFSTAAAENTNSTDAEMGIGNAKAGTIQLALRQVIASIFPNKTWAFLMPILGVEERVAKHRMSLTRSFSAEETAILLHSEHGFEVLKAIMALAARPPLWWRICAPLMKVADAQRMQEVARRSVIKAVNGALNADRDLAATISRGEAALMVQDEDFYRSQFDPFREMGRAGRGVSPRGASRGVVDQKRARSK